MSRLRHFFDTRRKTAIALFAFLYPPLALTLALLVANLLDIRFPAPPGIGALAVIAITIWPVIYSFAYLPVSDPDKRMEYIITVTFFYTPLLAVWLALLFYGYCLIAWFFFSGPLYL